MLAGDGRRQHARAASDRRLADGRAGADGIGGCGEARFRRELDQIEDAEERERRVRELTEAAHENARALNAATLFELDDVIDPAETGDLIATTHAAAGPDPGPRREGHRFVDTW